MSQQVVFAGSYVTATLEPGSALLVYRRNAIAYPSLDDMHTEHRMLVDALSKLDGKSLSLLFDLRTAPPRNDPTFEAEVTRAMAPLFAQFPSRAFLVKTAAGSLQVRRLSGASGAPANSVFTDEATARAFLARP